MLFIFMGIGITAWMGTARLARGQILLSLKQKEFIEASHMIGRQRHSHYRAAHPAEHHGPDPGECDAGHSRLY